MNKTFSLLKRATAFFALFALIFSHSAKADLTFDPHSLDFGSVIQGVQFCRSVVVTNTFDFNITITGWSFHNQSTELSLAPVFSQNVQLAHGESITLQICYTPNGTVDAFQNAFIVSYISAGHDTSVHSGHISFTGSVDHHHDTDTTHHDDTTHHHTDTTIVHHHCLSVHQGDGSNDPVVIGATAEHTIYLINPTNFDITVTGATISGTQAGAFIITSTFPLLVPANTSNTALTYTFSPDSSGHHVFSADLLLTLSGDSLGCQTVTGNVIGYPVVEHNSSGHNTDTVIHALFPTEHRTLGIEGNGHHTSMTFYFTNNLSVDVTVNNIYLDDVTYFTIVSTNPTPTPFVLHPNDRLTVTINYIATDQQVHYAHLQIDADHQLQSTSFDLQGIQLASATVSNILPSGVTISISPNPASEYLKVDLSGIHSAKLQLVDLLGKTIAEGSANSKWEFHSANLPNGTYIVRIAGESLNDENFIISKRIVVSK